MAPLAERGIVTGRALVRRSNNSTTIILIVGLALLSLVCLGLVSALIVSRLRRRRSQNTEADTGPGTARTWHGILKPALRLPAEKNAGFEDIQREVLIRKSLASRHGSMSSGGPVSPAVVEDVIDLEERQDLRADWKRWEARVQHERSVSLEEHPALGHYSTDVRDTGDAADTDTDVDMDIHPALRSSSPRWSPLSPLSPLPHLPMPSVGPPATVRFLLGKETDIGEYSPIATNDNHKF